MVLRMLSIGPPACRAQQSKIKSHRQVEILVPLAFGAILTVVGVVAHSPPESGGVPSRSEGGAVCSKTNSTD